MCARISIVPRASVRCVFLMPPFVTFYSSLTEGTLRENCSRGCVSTNIFAAGRESFRRGDYLAVISRLHSLKHLCPQLNLFWVG